jgi:hypothetical protein
MNPSRPPRHVDPAASLLHHVQGHDPLLAIQPVRRIVVHDHAPAFERLQLDTSIYRVLAWFEGEC